jgi:hypothetical protein
MIIDVAAGIECTRTLARVEDVVATVQEWLAEFQGGQQPPL